MLPEVRCVGTIFSRNNLAEKKPIKRAKSKSRSGWAAVHKNCEWDPQFTLTQPLDALEYYSLHTGSSFGQSSCLIARSKHVGLGRARERKSLQRSLNNLRSAPSSAWLICQIIKVEWTNQKKKKPEMTLWLNAHSTEKLSFLVHFAKFTKILSSSSSVMVHISYQGIKQPRNVLKLNIFGNVKEIKFSKYEACYREFFCF